MTRLTILTYILTTFSIVAFGQTDTIKKKYEYEICVYYSPKEKPTLIKNKVIESADTIISTIQGRVYDNKNKPIQFALVILDNKKDSLKKSSFADSLGNFTMHISPGIYNLKIATIGYTKFSYEGLQINPGEIRQIEIRLGNSSGFKTWGITSDKPLSKKKLKRVEQRLRHKG